MIKTVVYSTCALTISAAVYAFMPDVATNSILDNTIRVVVLGKIAFGISLMCLILVDLAGLKFDQQDEIIWPIRMFIVSTSISWLFAAYVIWSRFGTGYITWRIPLGIFTYLIGDIALVRIYFQIRHWVIRATQTGATVKIDAVDTSKPGPNISLTEQNHV